MKGFSINHQRRKDLSLHSVAFIMCTDIFNLHSDKRRRLTWLRIPLFLDFVPVSVYRCNVVQAGRLESGVVLMVQVTSLKSSISNAWPHRRYLLLIPWPFDRGEWGAKCQKATLGRRECWTQKGEGWGGHLKVFCEALFEKIHPWPWVCSRDNERWWAPFPHTDRTPDRTPVHGMDTWLRANHATSNCTILEGGYTNTKVELMEY